MAWRNPSLVPCRESSVGTCGTRGQDFLVRLSSVVLDLKCLNGSIHSSPFHPAPINSALFDFSNLFHLIFPDLLCLISHISYPLLTAPVLLASLPYTPSPLSLHTIRGTRALCPQFHWPHANLRPRAGMLGLTRSSTTQRPPPKRCAPLTALLQVLTVHNADLANTLSGAWVGACFSQALIACKVACNTCQALSNV